MRKHPTLRSGGMASSVDRTKVTPFLLKVFWDHGKHHEVEALVSDDTSHFPQLHAYVWPDSTLGEIAQAMAQLEPFADKDSAYLHVCSLRRISDDRYGRFRYAGSVTLDSESCEFRRSLAACDIAPGDILDIAIIKETKFTKATSTTRK